MLRDSYDGRWRRLPSRLPVCGQFDVFGAVSLCNSHKRDMFINFSKEDYGQFREIRDVGDLAILLSDLTKALWS